MAQVQEVDVLICGSGSAGLCAATWLARCGVRCRVLEARGGPLEVGQADGVQCRTVEIMESFGIVDGLLREAYHVLETVFWSAAGADGKLVRTRRTADTAPGLSHQPHVILNQARMHSFLVDAMRRFNGQEIDYGYRVKSVSVDKSLVDDPAAHPVTVVAEHEGREEVFKAKYALVRRNSPQHPYGALNLKVRRAVTARIARCANPWASRWSGTAPIPSGA